MTQQFTQEWSDFCKKMSELNASAFNQFAKGNNLNEWLDAKNMNDMRTVQSKFCNRWNEVSWGHAQKSASAWTEWMNNWNNQCTKLSDEMSKATPMDFAQQAMSSWCDAVMQCNRRFTQMTGEIMKSSSAPAAKPAPVKATTVDK